MLFSVPAQDRVLETLQALYELQEDMAAQAVDEAVAEYGEAYLAYRAKVKRRIIPYVL